MDLFRTLHPQRELSARALALTTHLAMLNPSSYSVWAYRADILVDGPATISPGADARLGSRGLGPKVARLRRELAWMEEMARGNMKSYQVWQHRRLILSALDLALQEGAGHDPADGDAFGEDLVRELAFIGTVLARDSKNYHTWAYRQWVLAHYGGLGPAGAPTAAQGKRPWLWEPELAYTQSLLVADARNNSAWNHRFFLLFGSRRAEGGPAAVGLAKGTTDTATNTPSPTPSENVQACVKLEVGFVKAGISTVPNNASAWAYLRGIIALGDGDGTEPQPKGKQPEPPKPIANVLARYDLPRWVESVLLPPGILSQANADAPSPLPAPALALEYLLDNVEAQAEAAKASAADGPAVEGKDAGEGQAEGESARLLLRSRATRLASLLTSADPVRARWWEYKARRVAGLLA